LSAICATNLRVSNPPTILDRSETELISITAKHLLRLLANETELVQDDRTPMEVVIDGINSLKQLSKKQKASRVRDAYGIFEGPLNILNPLVKAKSTVFVKREILLSQERVPRAICAVDPLFRDI